MKQMMRFLGLLMTLSLVLTSVGCEWNTTTEYTLTVSTSGSGSVSPSSGTYEEDTTVTLTATPASGWVFAGWSGDASGTSSSIQITMDSNKSVTATFTQSSTTQYILSVSTSGSGSVSPTGGTYDAGTTVTLYATPASGWDFSGWSGSVSGSSTSIQVTMNANKSVLATFTAISQGGTEIDFQAESASMSNAVVESEHSGYSGSGYVNFANTTGSSMSFVVNALSSGNVDLTFRFANGASSARPMDIDVNGSTQVYDLSFTATGAWTSWNEITATVYLNSGENEIDVISSGSDGGPNMDMVTVAGDIDGVTAGSGGGTVTDYDVVVAKDGSGNYSSVQSAINAAPSNRSSWYTIFIKNGRYREVVTVPSNKPYLRLAGESAGGTIISYGNYASLVGSTSGSATAFFEAKNFIAKNITFENSFDYPNSSAANKQAVAAEPKADRQVFMNCRFTGYQDTLYVRNTSRVYFKDCFIQGHTDFIFGDATAVFYQCEINSRQKNGGCISAPSTLASTSYGLIFIDCDVTQTGSSTGVWLGRPWHPSSSSAYLKSNAVYLYCYLGSHINSEGWTSMSGVYPATERLWEYSNSGPGAVINSSRTQLSSSQAASYTVSNILRGSDNWDPEAWANME